MPYATAAVAVGLLTLGGNAGAWAATGAGAPPSRTSLVPAPAPAGASGTVAAVAPGSFTLSVPGARPLTVIVTPSTVFAETGAAVAPVGVTVGEQVTVTPVTGPPLRVSSVTAARVLVVLTHIIGTVQSVGTGSFMLQLVGGLVLPVTTTPTTAVRNGGVRQPAVYVGQYVTAYGAADPGDPSRLIAQFVVVTDPPPVPVPPGSSPCSGSPGVALVTGSVSSVEPGSFVLAEAGGALVTVETPPSTTFGETGSPTAPSGVAVGQQVRVTPVGAVPPPPTSFTAARVVVVLTQVTGTVLTVAATSFTVQLFGGLVVTVATTGAQVFATDCSTTAHVATGETVTAYGAADATVPSRLDAQFVHLVPPTSSGPGCGGDGGHGWDDGWGTSGAGHDGDGSGWSGHGTPGGSWSHG